MLGGKGANQAVGLAQLGLRPVLSASWETTRTPPTLLDRAQRDGIDTACVVRRPGTSTGLIVNVVDSDARWRYLQDLPSATLLTAGGPHRRSSAVLRAADVSRPATAAAARGRPRRR